MHACLLRKRPLQQKAPLTVNQVICLERMCEDADHVPDRVMAGQALFCIYARARWSDGQFVEHLSLDQACSENAYIQCETRTSKTSTTAEKKTRFLPLTALAFGLDRPDWYNSWLNARRESGLRCA